MKQEIYDGYEENPWENEGEIRVVEDFLPAPEIMKNAKTYLISEENRFPRKDLGIIEQIAISQNLTTHALIASILHDFAAGNLIRK